MGFIETPYRRVENGKVDMDNSHIHYYSAEEEEDLVAAQANTPIDGEAISWSRIASRRVKAPISPW